MLYSLRQPYVVNSRKHVWCVHAYHAIPRFVYVRRLFSVLKLPNEEKALVYVVENGEIVTEETLSRKRMQRKGKDMERRRNGSFE